MDNPDSVKSINDFAKILTREYDLLVKTGFDTINNIKLISGNTKLMETTLVGILNKTKNSNTSPTPIVNDLGKAFVSYWIGAQMNSFPPPLIPSPISIQNILILNSIITNTGTWPTLPPQPPVPKTTPFINILSTAIKLHLLTVGGIYFTISLYPPFSIPAPGLVTWTGFTVQ